MRHSRFAVAFIAAACAVFGLSVLPAAAVAPDAPTISQIVGATTFLTSPAAGPSSTPAVTITGVTVGDLVTLSGGQAPATCTGATATVVVFNANGGTTGCTTSSPFTVGNSDGKFSLTATRTIVPDGQSAPSNTFVYYRDTVAPAAPTNPAASQLPEGGIRVTWTAPPVGATESPMRYYHLWRTDGADPATATYVDMGTLDADAVCTGTDCSTDDVGVIGTKYFYKISADDLAANTGPKSGPAPAAAPGIEAVAVPAPSIASVNADDTSPAFQPDASLRQPDVVIDLAIDSGTVALTIDGVQVATKDVTGYEVTIDDTDYATNAGAHSRFNALRAIQTVESVSSHPSDPFTFVMPPAAPTITEVAGGTSSPAKAAVEQPTVQFSLNGTATNDTVDLYADDDCAGAHAPVKVATATGVSGTTGTISSLAGHWGTNKLAKGVTYCLQVKATDNAITQVDTQVSPLSNTFVFERAPIVSGYVMEGGGFIKAFGSAPVITSGPNWGNWDIAKRLAMATGGTGGYVLDGYGGVHPVGGAPAVAGAPYWGWDIARDLVMISPVAGYVLDGYGGIHPFGGAPAINGGAYWSGFDIAKRMVLLPDKTGGYVLDGWGGMHAFGTGATPPLASPSGAYWAGWNIARGIVLRDATSGYTLDGWGGVHPFGGAPNAPASRITAGFDIARGLTITEVDGNGGYVLDGNGRASTWGDSVAITRPHTNGIDFARDLVTFTS